MNASLQKQREDTEKQWRDKVENKVEQEQKKRKNVIQQRDELIETMKELNNALRAKENESKS